MLPGFRFKVPMMIVLDTLKNEEPNLRRIGETWMRCSLKSYLRYAFITHPGSCSPWISDFQRTRSYSVRTHGPFDPQVNIDHESEG